MRALFVELESSHVKGRLRRRVGGIVDIGRLGEVQVAEHAPDVDDTPLETLAKEREKGDGEEDGADDVDAPLSEKQSVSE